MLMFLVVGALFCSVLLFGNKYIYVSSHQHLAYGSLFVLVCTFMIVYIPESYPGSCTDPLPNPTPAFFLLIAAEFARAVSDIPIDLSLLALTNAHIISRLSTHLASGGLACDKGVFSGAVLAIACCAALEWKRLRKPAAPAAAAADARLRF